MLLQNRCRNALNVGIGMNGRLTLLCPKEVTELDQHRDNGTGVEKHDFDEVVPATDLPRRFVKPSWLVRCVNVRELQGDATNP